MLQYYFYSEYCYYYCLLIPALKTLVHGKIFDEIMIKHESNTTLKLFKINFNILTVINKYSYKRMIFFDVILLNFISDIRFDLGQIIYTYLKPYTKTIVNWKVFVENIVGIKIKKFYCFIGKCSTYNENTVK